MRSNFLELGCFHKLAEPKVEPKQYSSYDGHLDLQDGTPIFLETLAVYFKIGAQVSGHDQRHELPRTSNTFKKGV